MNKRLFKIFLLHAFFYVAIPALIGLVDFDTLLKASGLCMLVVLGAYLVFSRKEQNPFELQDSFKETLLFLNWICLASGIVVSFLLLEKTDFRPFSIERSELFLLRQSVLTPTVVILFNLGIVASALLSGADKKYAFGFAVPILFEAISQSRGFVLSCILAAYVANVLPRKYIFLGALVLISISFLRMPSNVGVWDLMFYVSAESINTAIGSLLVQTSEFSVSLLQASRAVFAFIPFLGGLIGLDSEAIAYNKILSSDFDVYGLAFGILGFSKFGSIAVILLTAVVGFYAYKLLRKLGLSYEALTLLIVVQMPVFFRWSPAEFFYITTRIGIFLLTVHWIGLAVTIAATKISTQIIAHRADSV